MPNDSFAMFCPFYVHMSQFLHLTGVCHLGGLAVQDKSMGVKKGRSSVEPPIVGKHWGKY